MSRGACVAAVVILVVAGCRRSAQQADTAAVPRIADEAPAVPDRPAPDNETETGDTSVPASDAATTADTRAGDLDPPSFVWGEGDRSTLPPQDALFLERIVPLLGDFHLVAFRVPAEQTKELGLRDAAENTLGERTLRRLPVTGTQNPASTGALAVTFWKTDDGLYFLRRSGGCVAFRELLYGPFRAQGDTFVFARDAHVPAPAGGGAVPPCMTTGTDWCPPVPGDACGEHRDAASCVADPRCVLRPYLDDSLRPCGELNNDCRSEGCPPVGCVAKCNQLATEADCTAQAPRCSWAGDRCYGDFGDCAW